MPRSIGDRPSVVRDRAPRRRLGATLPALIGAVAVLIAVGWGTSRAATLTGGAAATVAGTPITIATADHWITVAVHNQPAHAPVIVPLDPPAFARCIAEARKVKALAGRSTKRLRTDCRALFTDVSSQVMDFLIKATWYELDAARLHISFSTAEVTRALHAAEAKQFPSAAALRSFLRDTGQTVDDLRFRVRVSLIYTALLRRAGDKQSALAAQARRLFLAQTTCAADYTMADCANDRR